MTSPKNNYKILCIHLFLLPVWYPSYSPTYVQTTQTYGGRIWSVRIVLAYVVAVGGLMRVMTVDEVQRRHVLLPGDVAVTAAHVGVGSERGRVGAKERVGEVELVLERHPDEQVLVTATR